MLKFDVEPSHYSEQLKTCKMSCDTLFNRNVNPPYPNKSFFMCIVGPPGTGKTSQLFTMLSKQKKKTDNIYYKVFSDILYVSPESSRSSVTDNPLDSLSDGSVFESMSYEVLEKIKENRKRYGTSGRAQLLILDDVTAQLKNNEIALMINELAMNRRHHSLSIICLVQRLSSIPKTTRMQISHCILFKSNAADNTIYREEMMDSQFNKQEFNQLRRYVFRNKHDFLFIDKEGQQVYKNLQKIIIKT